MVTKLQEARAEQDFTQEKLAAEAGVGVATVIRAEAGLNISPLSKARLARALDMKPSDLFPEEVSA